jgi:type VI protein secretion system component Hcp
MRILIFALLLSPFFGFSQKSNATVFIRISDTKGLQIIGESIAKGFEKWIEASSTNSGGKNNTQFNFTMQVGGAAADLKRAMNNNEFLAKTEVTVIAPNPGGVGPQVLVYTIKMEQVKVLSCAEGIGCNNAMNTAVILQATRIGWTYYNQTRTGTTAVSKKFGWNADTQSEWTSF